jgi:sulfur relay (sulfurtransferase) DsrC/TusE family protein
VVTGHANGRTHSHVVALNLSNAPETAETTQWEHKLISAATEQEILAQANKLGAENWELVSVVRTSGTPAWRAFLKRPKVE